MWECGNVSVAVMRGRQLISDFSSPFLLQELFLSPAPARTSLFTRARVEQPADMESGS